MSYEPGIHGVLLDDLVDEVVLLRERVEALERQLRRLDALASGVAEGSGEAVDSVTSDRT
jgi:hypothetical protein